MNNKEYSPFTPGSPVELFVGRSKQIEEIIRYIKQALSGKQENFLRKMRELGVIEPDVEKERGTYRFVNEIYPLYIGIESQRFNKKFSIN